MCFIKVDQLIGEHMLQVHFLKYGSEIEYNTSCTIVMALEKFSILNNEFLNMDPYVVPEKSPLIILDNNLALCMDNDGKYTKHNIPNA